MLKSLAIQNFQSWKSVYLEFDPGVNVIIGTSDCGKSAILRAMLWTIFNRPGGEQFRSRWGSDTAVDIELDNEKTISREKGKENLYVISSSSLKKPIEFKAFGQSIPEEISNLFNISDINVQRQMDAPFLLSSTPGEVGKILNKAVKLDIIDVAQKNISSTLRQENNQLLNTRSTIASKQEELEKYTWLSEADLIIQKLESINLKILKTKGQTIDLTGVISEINTLDLSIQRSQGILAYSEKVNTLIGIDNEINITKNDYNKINELVTGIYAQEKQIKESSAFIESDLKVNTLIGIDNWIDTVTNDYNEINTLIKSICTQEKQIKDLAPFIKVETEVQKLIKSLGEYSNLDIQYEMLSYKIDQIEREVNKIDYETERMSGLQVKFDRLMPDVCPLCLRGD